MSLNGKPFAFVVVTDATAANDSVATITKIAKVDFIRVTHKRYATKLKNLIRYLNY